MSATDDHEVFGDERFQHDTCHGTGRRRSPCRSWRDGVHERAAVQHGGRRDAVDGDRHLRAGRARRRERFGDVLVAGRIPQGGSAGAQPEPPQQSLLDAVKHKKCSTSTFTHEAGIAGGALRAYVSKPAANGVLAPGAAGPIAQARSAVGFAGAKLQHAKDSLEGCPATTNNLKSVLGQNVALLRSFRKELTAGKVLTNRSEAAMAMFANVVSQADHLRLKVTEVVPPAVQLGR